MLPYNIHEDAKAAATPEAIGQFDTEIASLMKRIRRLREDLAEGRLIEEMVRFSHEEVKAAATPEAIWRFETEVVSLVKTARRLCHDLAERRLDEELATFEINVLSHRLRRVAERKELQYWLGRAYAKRQPAPEPTNPLCENYHIWVICLVFDFLQPILAHQIVKNRPSESTIKVPQVLEGKIDLKALADFAASYKPSFDALDEEDISLLRGEAELACELLSEQQKVVSTQADNAGRPTADGANNKTGKEQTAGSRQARALQSLMGEEDAEILKIALSDRTADDRMRAICLVDVRFLDWESLAWGDLLGVSDGAVRQTAFWKTDRHDAIKAGMREVVRRSQGGDPPNRHKEG